MRARSASHSSNANEPAFARIVKMEEEEEDREREREGGKREHYTFTIVGFHLLCQNTCGLSAGLFFNLNIPRGSLNKKMIL